MNSKTFVFIAVAVIVLIALFVWLSPHSASNNNFISTTADVSPKVFELVLKNNKLISGPTIIQVAEGDHVVLKIMSDVDGEVHLHGYDKKLDLTKNVQGELALTASITGRFEYELEDTGTKIGALEVLPK